MTLYFRLWTWPFFFTFPKELSLMTPWLKAVKEYFSGYCNLQESVTQEILVLYECCIKADQQANHP